MSKKNPEPAPTTPSAAIRYETGTLFVEMRVDKTQLQYLHKILQRPDDHWTHYILKTLSDMGIGWAAEIDKKLMRYELETDWVKISRKTAAEWKAQVNQAIEVENKKKILSLCHKNRTMERTKTKYLIARLQSDDYKRSKHGPSMELTRLQCKAIIMARSGMLDCAANYKNKYKTDKCKECKMKDDEAHRINECRIHSVTNNFHNDQKFDFNNVYSESAEDLKNAAKSILHIWDLANGKNIIRRPDHEIVYHE